MSTGDEGPYSRVYHDILGDEKFLEVYWRDGRLATWLRLLIAADQAYPNPAVLPTKNRVDVDFLVKVGLVKRVGLRQFLVTGLAAERQRRTEQAKEAAHTRWMRTDAPAMRTDAAAMRSHSASNAAAMLDKTRQDKTRQDEQRQEEPDAVAAYFSLTASRPSPGAHRWIERLVSDFGEEPTEKALAETWQMSSDKGTFLSRTEAALGLAKHHADRAKAAPTPPPDDPPPNGDPTAGKAAWQALSSKFGKPERGGVKRLGEVLT